MRVCQNRAMRTPDRYSLLGLTAGRRACQPVRIGLRDQMQHLYVLGKSGTGKSTLLQSLIRQTLRSGFGLCLLDPHGDLAETVAGSGVGSVVSWDVSDLAAGRSFNPLRQPPKPYVSLAASGLLEAMKHLWADAWGVRMEHILRHTFLALLEAGGADLSDVLRMLSDKSFRRDVLNRVHNPQVLAFWQVEFANYPARLKADAIAPIQNKIGALLADPLMQSLLLGDGEPVSFRRAMDRGECWVINLAKGKLGADTSNLLGAMLVSMIGLAAFSRADTPEAERYPFFVYVDEFQNFTTLSFAVMLSELRKYGVGLVLAHQYVHQLSVDVREAVFGNCGTLIMFRVGGSDAPYLARELLPEFTVTDLLRLPNYRAYIKLMINGAPSRPFSLQTLEPEGALQRTANPFLGRFHPGGWASQE